MCCVMKSYGISGRCCRNKGPRKFRKRITPCVNVSKNKTHTLIEKWYVNDNNGWNTSLVRILLGAPINKSVDSESKRVILFLLDHETDLTWWDFAGVLLIDPLVYRCHPTTHKEGR